MWISLLFWMFLDELRIYGVSVSAYPGLNSNREGLAQDVMFPTSGESTDRDLYSAISPQCHNETFCENIKNYPTHLFYQVLTSSAYGVKYQQYFRNLKDTEVIVNSRKQEKNEFFICPSTKSIVYPKAALNIKQEIKFIYNLDGYRQGVSVEVCVKKSKCKFYDKVKNFRTKCKQKFVEKLLLTADDNGRPYVDRYRFPSACVCSYRDDSNFSRFTTLYS